MGGLPFGASTPLSRARKRMGRGSFAGSRFTTRSVRTSVRLGLWKTSISRKPAAARHDHMLHHVRPLGRRGVAEVPINAQAGLFDRTALAHARRRPGDGVRAALLPVPHEHPMGHVRDQEVTDAAMPFQLGAKALVITRRGMQPEIAVAEPDGGHPHRKRHAHDSDRPAIDDPYLVGHRLQRIERRIGRGIGRGRRAHRDRIGQAPRLRTPSAIAPPASSRSGASMRR